MGKKIAVLWTLLLALACSHVYAQLGQPAPPVASNGFIVKFSANTTRSSRDHVLSTAGLRTVEAFSLVPGLVFTRPVAGQKAANSVSALAANPNVEYIEPDYVLSVARMPNDMLYSNLYALNNTGQTGGVANADINAPEAWDVTTGKEVIVAVIDTGVDYNHDDLRANMWTNPGEIPGNGLDDDSNGFVDDVHGFDFTTNNGSPMDDMGHGTHVAGIIGAVGNNGVGAVGVNWSARIMALRFMDVQGFGATSNAIRALNYAVAMGARVSNASWGGGAFSQAMYDTLAAANQAGHIFVTAAGNESQDLDVVPHYPSGYDLPNVIGVAGSNAKDEYALFSNFGATSIDLAAPGDRIESTFKGNTYQTLTGTSMSSPYVAGAVSLLLSVAPDLPVGRIRSAILDTVDVLPTLLGRVATSGRLNVQKALQSLTASMSISPQTVRLSINKTQQFNVSGGVGPYTWGLTNPSVGSIGAGDGLLVTTGPGVTQVTVRDALGASVRSGDIYIDRLTITPQTALLQIGSILQFSVSGGVPPYRYTSSVPAVASIDPFNPVLTALSPGAVFVTATDQNSVEARTGKIEVFALTPLSFSPLNAILAPGGTQQFVAAGGIPPYRWTSQTPAVVGVQPDTGLATALAAGTATLLLQDAAGNSALTGTLEVVTLRVALASGTSSILVGDSVNLSAVGGTPPYEWRVSDSSVASVDAGGNLFAILPGVVRITVMDRAGNVARSDVINVLQNSTLKISAAASVLTRGQATRLFVSGGVPPYRWTVTNGSVLSMNESTGMATAIGPGTAAVNVLDSAGSSVSTGSIEVRQITLTPSGGSYLVGQAVGLAANGGRAPYRWTLSDSSIATVDAAGNLRAMGVGALSVTATDADNIVGTSGIFTFSANGVVQNPISIKPNSATISAKGAGMSFLAVGGTAPYLYSLGNPAVGSINPISGVFTPKTTASGDTTVVVKDAKGQVAESGIVAVR